jgi:tetratricopeptide (TPR) repeat protein
LKRIIILLFTVIIITFPIYCNQLDDIIDKTIRYDKWIEAKQALEEYLRSNPSDSNGLAQYANVLRQLKLNEDAISSYKSAINYEISNEKKGKYYFNIGEVYYDKGSKDIALEMFDKSISLNSLFAEPYYMIGRISYDNKNYDKFLASWKKYVELSTNIDKKQKVQNVLLRYEKQIADEKKLIEDKRIKDEIEKKRLEEEKRKRDEDLKKLMDELESDKTDSKSLEENKVKKDKSAVDYEDIE